MNPICQHARLRGYCLACRANRPAAPLHEYGWAFLAWTIIGLILYACASGCAPQPPKHPAPIQAPRPCCGKKIVKMLYWTTS